MDDNTLNRLLDNPALFALSLVTGSIVGVAYLVYRFVPVSKRKTDEHLRVKSADLLEVNAQLTKSLALAMELLNRYERTQALNPPIDDKW